jgi:hypothetical protein
MQSSLLLATNLTLYKMYTSATPATRWKQRGRVVTDTGMHFVSYAEVRATCAHFDYNNSHSAYWHADSSPPLFQRLGASISPPATPNRPVSALCLMIVEIQGGKIEDGISTCQPRLDGWGL